MQHCSMRLRVRLVCWCLGSLWLRVRTGWGYESARLCAVLRPVWAL
jgi:hypothetical protein